MQPIELQLLIPGQQWVQLRTVVTGINPQALLPHGITPLAGETNALSTAETLPFGPVLDVLPTLEADGHTITMNVIPTVTEFMGYDYATNFVPAYVSGERTNAVLPLPRFRVRHATARAAMHDGQTLVVGTISDDMISTTPLGNTIANQFSDPNKKQLLVFVTARLVDPAGNPIHRDDQMPFKPDSIPPQPPAATGPR